MSQEELPSKVKELAIDLATSLSSLSDEDRDKVLFIAAGGKHIKPPLWSTNSRAGYYDEKYARWLQKDLDLFLSKPKTFVALYKFSIYRLKRRTLTNRIAQAWAYLIDYLDTPDKKYANLRTSVMISQHHPDGVCLIWKKDKTSLVIDNKLEPEFQEEKIHQEAPWKIAIDNFLENAQENEKMDLSVRITQQDVDWLTQEYLAGMSESIVWTITTHKILLIKNRDLAKAVKDLGIKTTSKMFEG